MQRRDDYQGRASVELASVKSVMMGWRIARERQTVTPRRRVIGEQCEAYATALVARSPVRRRQLRAKPIAAGTHGHWVSSFIRHTADSVHDSSEERVSATNDRHLACRLCGPANGHAAADHHSRSISYAPTNADTPADTDFSAFCHSHVTSNRCPCYPDRQH